MGRLMKRYSAVCHLRDLSGNPCQALQGSSPISIHERRGNPESIPSQRQTFPFQIFMSLSQNSSHSHLPPIIRTVLSQAARAHAEGRISQAVFDAQIARLVKEELQPRGL